MPILLQQRGSRLEEHLGKRVFGGQGRFVVSLFLFCFLETGFLELRVPPVFAFHAGIKGIRHTHLFVKLNSHTFRFMTNVFSLYSVKSSLVIERF